MLCLHLKRFEHSSTKQQSRKLDTHVAFPLNLLDMRPYRASAILATRHGLVSGMGHHVGVAWVTMLSGMGHHVASN